MVYWSCLHVFKHVLNDRACLNTYTLKGWTWFDAFFPAFTQTFLFSIRASSHCPALSVIFLCQLSVSHLWCGNSTVCRALYSSAGSSLCRVCFTCSAEWKLFPPAGRWCSISELSSKVTSHSASWWPTDANTSLKVPLKVPLRLGCVLCRQM